MSNLVARTIRTAVPAAVGAFVLMLADRGIHLDDMAINGAVAFLVGLFTAIYYLLVRVIGKKYPWVEAFLGSTNQPDQKDD